MTSRIYLAAALFNGRETAFNLTLAEHLEAAGHAVDLPQRDGFEFAALDEQLRRHLPADALSSAVQQIIYHLDLGWFLPRCNRVVAVLDEPLDDGVLIELAYARMGGIPIIGLRTDVRSPNGSLDDLGGGAHFFPVLQCDRLVRGRLPHATRTQADQDLRHLWSRLDQAIADLPPRPATPPPAWQSIIDRAHYLFAGITDHQSPAGLATICQRLAHQWPEWSAAMPRQTR